MRLFVFYVPNLRFNEDCDDWKLIRINSLLKFQNGINASPEKYGKGIKYISVSDILNNKFITNKNIKGLIDIDEKTFKNFEVSYGDILFQRSSETIEDIGRTNVYLDENTNSTFGGFVIRGKKIGNYNPIFFKYLLDSPTARKSIIRMGAGAQHYNISQEGLDKIKLHFPNDLIQEKIANLFMLIDNCIETQNKIINKLESLICSLRSDIFSKYDWKWQSLDSFINNGTITLKRGNVIPKHEKNEEYKFPVYSSSIHNNGLMGFNNSYMFDKELITWSVDGGGNFFYRSKHKFNVTNVCGIMEVKDNIFNYRFLSEILSAQHSKMIFDYQTKAHPSVIEKLYKLPIVEIKTQEKIALIFELYYQKLEKEKDILSLYKKQKAYLLQNMFI